jgi:hypothetical protein
MKNFVIGLIVGALSVVAIGMAIDYMLYGTVNPCEVVIQYEDNSSVIHCKEVK